MALLGLRHGNITHYDLGNEEQFAPRWHRFLFPTDGMPAADGHFELTVTAPIDASSAIPVDQDLGGLGPAPAATDGPPAPAAQIDDGGSPAGPTALDHFWHPPYFAPEPLVDGTGNPSVPGDAAPPPGFPPKAEAVIWSGPAMMIFPAESHDPVGDAAAPDAAGLPVAVSRADLDPVLTSMAGGTDHGTAPDSGGGDLSAAFLPPDTGDVADPGHGLDPGFAFTPPPMPPPPDLIG